MVSTSQLYLEVTTAVLLISTIGIIAVFLAAAITSDGVILVGASCAAMVLAAGILIARLWRLTRPPPVVAGDVQSK
jgi:hypothetical protein